MEKLPGSPGHPLAGCTGVSQLATRCKIIGQGAGNVNQLIFTVIFKSVPPGHMVHGDTNDLDEAVEPPCSRRQQLTWIFAGPGQMGKSG